MKWKSGVGYDQIEDRRSPPVGGGGDLKGRGPKPTPKPAKPSNRPVRLGKKR
jgi:hypothetical protein